MAAAAQVVEHPPGFRAGLISRKRLVSKLLSGGDAPIALLSAPAGYGKTTVLSEWEATDPRPFGWITLDHRHNDPAFLIASIAHALGEIEPVDQGVFDALSSPAPSISRVLVPRLHASLYERERKFVLVLDDLHAIDEAASLDALTAIAQRSPPMSGPIRWVARRHAIW